MAQQVVIAGAMFEDVPSISVPDANNVYHPFLDTTIPSNAAAASDITQGKLAYVNGSLVTGTNQGGGGGAVKVGALRPDAVLDQSWTYDKKIVADESIAIPSYTTTNTALKSATVLASNKALDNTQYDYMLTARGLAIPIYSSSAKGKGRIEYTVYSYAYEIDCLSPNTVKIGNVSSGNYGSITSSYSSVNMMVYWSNGSTVQTSTGSYGAFISGIIVTNSSNSSTGAPKITISSPSFAIRGSNNYFTSTYWGYVTDIRYQYIIELWKMPRTSSVDGFTLTSQLVHAAECAQSASGTLT